MAKEDVEYVMGGEDFWGVEWMAHYASTGMTYEFGVLLIELFEKWRDDGIAIFCRN